MAKPTVKPTAPKQKRGRPANNSNKRIKKSCVWFLSCFWPFHEVQIIHALKPLAWKSRDFFNRFNYQNYYLLKTLSIEISILRAPTSPLRPTPLNYSLMHKALVFLLSISTRLGGFSSTTFLSDFNNLLVFLFSFPIGLGGFSSINLSGFPPQYCHWVRRFFIDDLSIYNFINNVLVFFLSFPLG